MPVDLTGSLANDPCDYYLEIGPNGTVRQAVRHESSEKFVASLRAGHDEWEQLLTGLARFYLAGASVDWAGFSRGYGSRRVDLPNYPFERRRYWYSDTDELRQREAKSTLATSGEMSGTDRDNGHLATLAEEIERLPDSAIRSRLHGIEIETTVTDPSAVWSELKSRFEAWSGNRQELFIRLLERELARRNYDSRSGSGHWHEAGAGISDTELDELSESEAEALLLKKLEHLKF